MSKKKKKKVGERKRERESEIIKNREMNKIEKGKREKTVQVKESE